MDVDSYCFDYSNMASMMTEELGVSISQKVIKKIIWKNVKVNIHDCLSGKTMIVPTNQDNAETKITTESNDTRMNQQHPSNPNDPIAHALLYGTPAPASSNISQDLMKHVGLALQQILQGKEPATPIAEISPSADKYYLSLPILTVGAMTNSGQLQRWQAYLWR
jgi:hypothetical protein